MTSTVPAVVAWPVIIAMTILLVLRYWWCRTNLYERYFSNLMAFVLVAQLLRERGAENLLARLSIIDVTTSQELSFAAMIFAGTELIAFTVLWTGQPPEQTRRRHRYYRIGAVILCVAYLGAATRAREAGLTLEVAGGWDSILAWLFYLTMLFILSARVIWMFAAELRRSTQTSSRLLALGGLWVGFLTGAGCLEALVSAVTDQLGWTDTVDFRLKFHGFEFFYEAVFVFILGAIPLWMRMLSYFGLDSISRNWNKLQPLRISLVSVVPESVFDINHEHYGRQKTALQLHQTIIEIRDSILRLRPFFQSLNETDRDMFMRSNTVPSEECSSASDALKLAMAIRCKLDGNGPLDVPLEWGCRSTTLEHEVAELVKLSKWWAPACAAAAVS